MTITVSDFFAGAGVGGRRQHGNGPGGAVNTARSLTRSLDDSKEGLPCSLPVTSALGGERTRARIARTAASSCTPATRIARAERRRSALGAEPATPWRAVSSDAALAVRSARCATSAASRRLLVAAASRGHSRAITTTRQERGAGSSARAATRGSATSAIAPTCYERLRSISKPHLGSRPQRNATRGGAA